ncbi:MAG: hypothetical protein QOF33_3601 [Thermomicrobiales bacterium]|jgi:hypothetical protein|nr:hypothetical protein [Thermomicrobiales bacterium]MEA2585516.1 hypothetical protein [Thermomicrobiales bacterium]
MHAVYANPRQALKRAAEEAPEPLVRALADVLAASEERTDERMVVVRFRRDGGSSSEVFTLTQQEDEPARPVNLLEAFQATGEPYREALRRGREARQELLAAEGGVMIGAEVAKLLGLSRQAVDKRRRAGRLLGLSIGRRGFLYPTWQFTESGVLPGLEEVLEDLSDHDSWMQLVFMLTPDAWLDEETPLAELRRGNLDRVRIAAQMLGEHGAP